MVTLAKDQPRDFYEGDFQDYPMIASDILYQGAAIGDNAAGYSRPLVGGDQFRGFADDQVDNSSGSAGDKSVRARTKGTIKLSVSGAVITDVKQPVYATDDDTYVFNPVGATFIGWIRRWVSAGVVIVEYDAVNFKDPYGDGPRETVSANKTLDIQDTGKTFFVDTDAKVITLLTYAAGTAMKCKIVNIGAFGTVLVSIDPAAGDKVSGPDDTGADGGLLDNTKATAQRGDFSVLSSGGDDGYMVEDQKGIWTIA